MRERHLQHFFHDIDELACIEVLIDQFHLAQSEPLTVCDHNQIALIKGQDRSTVVLFMMSPFKNYDGRANERSEMETSEARSVSKILVGRTSIRLSLRQYKIGKKLCQESDLGNVPFKSGVVISRGST